MTVTTGGRNDSWPLSVSSSSMTSPSTERISTSKPNLSPTSLASVGSSRSFTMRMTPSSTSALITSPDFRRIFSASSATVTDAPTLTSSRLTSAGGASIVATAGDATMGSDVGAGREVISGGATAAAAAGRTGSRAGWGGRISRGGTGGRGGADTTRGGANG